jgi:hypothetical protein
LLLFPNYWQVFGMSAFLRSSLDDRLTRGGPSARRLREWRIETGIESDSRRRIGFELNPSHGGNLGGFQSRLEVAGGIKPSPSLR